MPFLSPVKNAAWVYVICALAAGCATPINSFLIKNVIDALNASTSHTLASVWTALLWIMVNFIVLDNGAWRLMAYIRATYVPRVVNAVTEDLMARVLSCSHRFFHQNLSGALAKQVSHVVDGSERLMAYFSGRLLRAVAVLGASLVAVFSVHFMFALILFGWFFVFWATSTVMARKIVHLASHQAATESTVMGQVTDTILNHSNVRIFNGLTHELTRIKPYLTQHAQAYRHTVMYGLFLRAVQGVMIALLFTACGVLLMHLYAQKKATVGDFALILGVTLETAMIIWYTMYEWEECAKVMGRMTQGLSVLLSENPVHTPTRTITARTLSNGKGHVQFNDVTFGYDKNTPVLTGFSLDIEPGSKVGFVGYSGGGKTTLFNLLLGLYPVAKGSITIDGISMNDIDTHTLRNAIGLIPQDTLLFDRTIQDNIRYARLDATDAEVIQAAQQACVHDFVTRLPDGYDTTVGERGTKLSGGQKQRIAIARAFLKNAPILMMDEATSQLDAETELMIQQSMDMLMRGKTTFVIAHRLSTILAMDRIIVLDKGTIVQDGTHADLIQHDGVYRTLWNAQTDGFLGMNNSTP